MQLIAHFNLIRKVATRLTFWDILDIQSGSTADVNQLNAVA